MFIGYIRYKWSFSIAMLIYQRVYSISRENVEIEILFLNSDQLNLFYLLGDL